VLLDPVQNTICSEKEIQCITEVNDYANQVGSRIKLICSCEPAQDSCIQVNRNPDIRIGVIVLEGSEEQEYYYKQDVEDFHDPNIQKALPIYQHVGTGGLLTVFKIRIGWFFASLFCPTLLSCGRGYIIRQFLPGLLLRLIG